MFSEYIITCLCQTRKVRQEIRGTLSFFFPLFLGDKRHTVDDGGEDQLQKDSSKSVSHKAGRKNACVARLQPAARLGLKQEVKGERSLIPEARIYYVIVWRHGSTAQ